MEHYIYIYILVAAAVSSLLRILPLTLIRGKIKNKFIRSFLYYLPYVTLAVMTFPAIIFGTETKIMGIMALAVGVILSWIGANLFQVAVACCGAVLLADIIMRLL